MQRGKNQISKCKTFVLVGPKNNNNNNNNNNNIMAHTCTS